MERISVIIPCHNDGRYLPEALASARRQDYPNLEIIVVDDHSTDQPTIEVLRREAAEGQTVLKTPAGKKGPAAARNLGIAAASGAFILPLDADDLLAPGYAGRAAAVLAGRPEVTLCYGRGRYFGLKKGPVNAPPYSWETMLTGNVIFNSAMFRKTGWEKAGGYDESLTLALEDYAFWLKLLASGGQAVRLEEVVFYYRLKSRSRSVAVAGDEALRTALEAVFRSCESVFTANALLTASAAHRLRAEQNRLKASLTWKLMSPFYALEQKARAWVRKRLGRA